MVFLALITQIPGFLWSSLPPLRATSPGVDLGMLALSISTRADLLSLCSKKETTGTAQASLFPPWGRVSLETAELHPGAWEEIGNWKPRRKLAWHAKMELNPTLDQGAKVRWDLHPCQVVVQ